MPTKLEKRKPDVTKVENLQLRKLEIFFKRSILHAILKILTMEHGGYRTLKNVKNINRLFVNIDEKLYAKDEVLKGYIWLISFFSKQWLAGILSIDLIFEAAKREADWDTGKEAIINNCLKDEILISEPEAKMIFELIGEALQYGYLASVKNEFHELLEDITFDNPGAFRELAQRLFMIGHSLLDIKHSTNFVANKVTFNTHDPDSIHNAVLETQKSLQASSAVLVTGIRRLNSLLSPGYMNGRLYVYLGLPAGGKSIMLLKSALDIRKYNPGFEPKTPGMRPCVLYITMENSFTETIERLWKMTFDDDMTDHDLPVAISMINKELGIGKIIDDRGKEYKYEEEEDKPKTKLLSDLLKEDDEDVDETPNIEMVIKYFSYREIDTDDLFTIIHDLRDEGLEVVALSFDYIKRIRPNVVSPDSVKLELNRIINELKALAVLVDIPVITAHQMNRVAAATVDQAARSGKGDVTKLVGRENVGDAWEVLETADWATIVNIEVKPGTDERYIFFNNVKRRRIDSSTGELAKYTHFAHPFSKMNGLKLLDDLRMDKVLSLQSLVTDIEDGPGKEKANLVPRESKVLPIAQEVMSLLANSKQDDDDDEL